LLKAWRSIPISQRLLELLERENSQSETKLFDCLRKEYAEIGYCDFATVLMRLEIQGKIQVTRFRREEKLVTLKNAKPNKRT